MRGPAPAVAMRGIDKRFGAAAANRAVDFTVARGSIHGLVGENGAGKSTLMSILYGFHAADSGTIAVNGRDAVIGSPADAIRLGIGMVHQHFMLVEAFTVVENVMLGMATGFLTAKAERGVRARLAELAEAYGLAIDPDARIADLSVGELQRVEIVKALVKGAEILILDEPTAVLTPQEADRLFVLLRRLAGEGRSIILVTHKLKEIMAVTDHVSVMRRGEMVATLATGATSPRELAELMVGRSVLLDPDRNARPPGATVLTVEGLSLVDARGHLRLDDASFEVRAGEIVGVAGVSGNGQSELLDILAGLRQPTGGRILLDGVPIRPGDDPVALRERGLRHVPEDRLRRGLVAAFDAADSAVLGCTPEPAFGPGPFLDRAAEIADCEARMASFDIRPRAPTLGTALFSGGNQQKLVLAREMERAPRLLLVGQPTRGVDVGAIAFIHARLVALRDAGAAVLLVSSELDEILALSDRILVMCGGRIVGERRAGETDETELGLMMAGLHGRAA
ncbi:MAG: ABC transporter ATP-binding protein [Proteobacteria bacterium]|nr:ABC transporter ATP-binding protein [Pseudomonadota bacterium]